MKRLCLILRFYSNVCREERRKTTKNLVRITCNVADIRAWDLQITKLAKPINRSFLLRIFQ